VKPPALAALALFIVLAVVHTWPLASAPGRLSRHDNADAMLNAWCIAWVAHAARTDPLGLFDANIFYPERRTLAYSEHLVVPALMVAPLAWLGASPVLAHNVLLIAGLALTGWTMCLVMTRWTRDAAAGVLAGCLLAFNAHTLTRLPHVQAMHAEFLPLALLALDRLLIEPRLRHAVALSAWSVLQSLCSGYMLVFTAASAAVSLAVRPSAWLGRGTGRTRALLLLSALVAGLALLPFLWPYYEARVGAGLTRSLDEVRRYSAAPVDYLATAGRLHYALWSHEFYRGTDALFPGVTAITLSLVAIATGALRRGAPRMFAAVGLMGVALSFGPAFPLYEWLYRAVPLLQGVRGAARFGYLLLVAVAALAGFGLARLREAAPRARAAIALVAIAAATAEAWRAPLAFVPFEGIPPVYDLLADEPGARVAEFPFFTPAEIHRNARYMLGSTRHWKPMLAGYSGFVPPGYVRHAEALRTFPDEASRGYLRALGVTHVVVHTDAAPDVARQLERSGAAVVLGSSRGIRVYRLR
jgi:hypothetical protein